MSDCAFHSDIVLYTNPCAHCITPEYLKNLTVIQLLSTTTPQILSQPNCPNTATCARESTVNWPNYYWAFSIANGHSTINAIQITVQSITFNHLNCSAQQFSSSKHPFLVQLNDTQHFFNNPPYECRYHWEWVSERWRHRTTVISSHQFDIEYVCNEIHPKYARTVTFGWHGMFC